ncbi:hypothetical protein LOD99_14792 [Oopsacas minuta]|uniref:Uncharacterized protein n=1 Tax=Oopsacas minuta TaxID=111878 RepID=A0AAV7KDH9_9METZ|nr:hypothetical protein LOD99_14792 [Oopsacas minuta]
MASLKKVLNYSQLFDEWRHNSDRDIFDSTVTPTDSPSSNNPFRVGMKLEAVDRKFPGLFCVASVIRVIDDELLIFFDGWPHYYNYWCHFKSPEVRPIHSCENSKLSLQIPNTGDRARELWRDTGEGHGWDVYLRNTRATILPDEKFFPLYLSQTNENMLSLFELTVRIILATDQINIYTLPVKIQEHLKEAIMCCICGTKFLLGWRCVRMFTCQRMLDPSDKAFNERARIVCSETCANIFTKTIPPNSGSWRWE